MLNVFENRKDCCLLTIYMYTPKFSWRVVHFTMCAYRRDLNQKLTIGTFLIVKKIFNDYSLICPSFTLVSFKLITEQLELVLLTLSTDSSVAKFSPASQQFYRVRRQIHITTNKMIATLHDTGQQPVPVRMPDDHGWILFIQRLLVKHVFSETRTNTLQVGDVRRDFLNGLDLLVKELTLQPVGHLSTTNSDNHSDELDQPNCEYLTSSLTTTITTVSKNFYKEKL